MAEFCILNEGEECRRAGGVDAVGGFGEISG